jgi:aspartyl protease family protein
VQPGQSPSTNLNQIDHRTVGTPQSESTLAPNEDPARKPSPWGNARPGHRGFGRRFLVLAAGLAALLVALFLLDEGGPAWGQDGRIGVVRLIVIAAACAAWLARSGQRLSVAVRNGAIWGGIALVVVIGYAHRGEVSAIGRRTIAALLPGRGETLDERTISFAAASDHHFWIDATANATTLRFLFDTGASGIILTTADAARLGFLPAELVFTTVFETANGKTRGAPILLDRLRIGPITLDHVDAWVNEGDMRQSLLGMRFLERMTQIEIAGDVLTIRR